MGKNGHAGQARETIGHQRSAVSGQQSAIHSLLEALPTDCMSISGPYQLYVRVHIFTFTFIFIFPNILGDVRSTRSFNL